MALVSRISHGSTVATNTALERRGARLGVITTAGFRDVLVRASGAVDFRDLKEKLVVRQNSTYEYFRRIIGDYAEIAET